MRVKQNDNGSIIVTIESQDVDAAVSRASIAEEVDNAVITLIGEFRIAIEPILTELIIKRLGLATSGKKNS